MFRRRLVLVYLFVFSVLGRLAYGADRGRFEPCYLPTTARDMLTTKLPAWTIVSMSDLTEHDRALWTAKHSRNCPGVAVGNYFGTREPSYAVALINRQQAKMLETLVVFKPNNGSYELIDLSKAQEATRVLVVFMLGPGVFEDLETGERVKSHNDAVAYEDIAAGMLVYVWRSGKFKEIQLSD